MKKVLICGDSFCVTDPDYKNLHWSEKILDLTEPLFELHNLSHGGDSNALIVLQLLQGLQFNPDFVILSFTSTFRFELDKNTETKFDSFEINKLTEFRHQRYTSTAYKQPDQTIQNIVDQWTSKIVSDEFELLKNYFLVSFCLTMLEKQKIPFCYSLGGLDFTQDKKNYTEILNKNFIKNYIAEFTSNSLYTNLWNHPRTPDRPYFHIADDSVQLTFAKECIMHLKNSNII